MVVLDGIDCVNFLFDCDSVSSSQGSVSFLNHFKMIVYLNSLVDVKVSCTVIS